MLVRKVYKDLLNWKINRNNKSLKEALLIKGARQVGKTSIIEEFGKKEYKSFIEINFIKNPEYKKIFAGSKEVNDILANFSIYIPDFKIVNGNTLIFLDEIQNCGDARTALKFLSCDFRFDVIASGSLLGLEYGEDADKNVEIPESIAVGFEMPLVLHSLDFEEYLWAKGYGDEQINLLKSYYESGEKIPDAINDKFEQLFREYMIIGGMPEVVYAFTKNADYNEAFRIQDKIINDYQTDISKHAKGEQKIKIKACYDSIPRQLARELKKFQYSFVEKGASNRKYGGSIKWLIDSSLVNVCYNVREPYIPLMANEVLEQFKLYINDTGLLTEMYGRETKIAILNNTIKGNAKGAIYENIISECLIKAGYKLHYYKPNDDNELEFIIEKNGEVIPIEVKSNNSSSVSLNRFIEKYNPSIAYKLIGGNNGSVGLKKTIPHYMIIFV